MFIVMLVLTVLLVASMVVIFSATANGIGIVKRLVRFAVGTVLFTTWLMVINSDYAQSTRDKMFAERQQAQAEDNKNAEINHPPRLVTTVKGCEIWEFYMNESYNHFLAKCTGTATVTYPIGKNSTQSITTETK
jgi:hypothetical protein